MWYLHFTPSTWLHVSLNLTQRRGQTLPVIARAPVKVRPLWGRVQGEQCVSEALRVNGLEATTAVCQVASLCQNVLRFSAPCIVMSRQDLLLAQRQKYALTLPPTPPVMGVGVPEIKVPTCRESSAIKESCSLNVIRSGWLGSKHRLTDQLFSTLT